MQYKQQSKFICYHLFQKSIQMPLIVRPISANLVKDFDLLGKSDPYCVIFIGNEKQRTRACNGGGKKPTWTDTFQFTSTDPILRLQVFDQDFLTKDDMIGEGTLNLNQFYQNPMRTENQYVDIINRGRSAGRVLLSIEYQGPPMGGGNWGGQQGGWGQQQGGWGGNQGGWGGNQGGWGGNQGGWGGQQGGWGGQQGGWGGQQGGWGGQQGGWGGQQGGWGGNQGGYGGNQGGWGPGSAGWNNGWR